MAIKKIIGGLQPVPSPMPRTPILKIIGGGAAAPPKPHAPYAYHLQCTNYFNLQN